MEDKVQGAATPEANPYALLMDQSSKSEDSKPAPWHTSSRWGEESLNLEDEFQGAVIPASDPAALSMDQSHIIHSPSMSECRLSILQHPILKPPPTNSKMPSLSRPIRGQIIKANRAKLDKAKHSASSQSIRKIMACKMNNKNRQSHEEVERALYHKLNEPLFLFPVDPSTKRLDTIKDGPMNRLLFKNKKLGPGETCPKQGIIYSQNVQGL